MASVDTNVLVRLIIGDDAQQVVRAEAFVENGAWVSHVVLTEAMWVLGSSYGFSATKLISALEMLLKHESLTIQDPETVSTALDLFRSRPRLRFTDCFIFETARKAGQLPLGTFDKDLGKVDSVQKL